jgi:hypothetical protein
MFLVANDWFDLKLVRGRQTVIESTTKLRRL